MDDNCLECGYGRKSIIHCVELKTTESAHHAFVIPAQEYFAQRRQCTGVGIDQLGGALSERDEARKERDQLRADNDAMSKRFMAKALEMDQLRAELAAEKARVTELRGLLANAVRGMDELAAEHSQDLDTARHTITQLREDAARLQGRLDEIRSIASTVTLKRHGCDPAAMHESLCNTGDFDTIGAKEAAEMFARIGSLASGSSTGEAEQRRVASCGHVAYRDHELDCIEDGCPNAAYQIVVPRPNPFFPALQRAAAIAEGKAQPAAPEPAPAPCPKPRCAGWKEMEPDEREDLDEQTFCDVEESSSGKGCRRGHCEADPAWHAAAPASAQGTTGRPCPRCGSSVSTLSSSMVCDRCGALWTEAYESGRAFGIGQRDSGLEALDKRVAALEEKADRLGSALFDHEVTCKSAPPQPAPVERHAYAEPSAGYGECCAAIRAGKGTYVRCGQPRSAAVHGEGGK